MDSICTENELIQQEEDEEEALSLCDLPTNEENQTRKEGLSSPRKSHEPQDDDQEFDFCSFSKESEMCAADEVFYQGQILPLHNSVSSEKGNGMSRCASMDRSYSTGFSSRSSSIRSLQSSTSSSGNGSCITTTATKSLNNIPRSRNQFHSHPSPTPQLLLSSAKQRNVRQSTRSNSSIWSIFRVGLVAPPEIALNDLRIRRDNNNNSSKLGSRNSSSSNSSDFSCSGRSKKKDKTRFFDKNGVLFGGCKCSADAVDTVSPKVVLIKRSASENETTNSTTNKHEQHRTRKQAFSRHRTFEWLKQLSLESATESDEALLPM